MARKSNLNAQMQFVSALQAALARGDKGTLASLLPQTDLPQPIFSNARRELRKLVRTEELSRGFHFHAFAAWAYYREMKLFAARVNQMVDAANTGFDWLVYGEPENKSEEPDEDGKATYRPRWKLKPPENALPREAHEDVLNWWSANVNRHLAMRANIVQGLDTVNGWTFLTQVLEGMTAFEWRRVPVTSDLNYKGSEVPVNGGESIPVQWYPDFPVTKGIFTLPMELSANSCTRILLRRVATDDNGNIKRDGMGNPLPGHKLSDHEEICELISGVMDKYHDSGDMSPLASALKIEGLLSEFNTGSKTALQVRAMPVDRSFALKYRWVPGAGTYPSSYVSGMWDDMEHIRLLQSLDKDTIKGIIRRFYYITVGVNPREEEELDTGTLDADGTEQTDQEGELTKWLDIWKKHSVIGGGVFPDWIKINVLEPDDDALLSIEKYFLPLVMINNDFGITTVMDPRANPNSDQVRVDMTRYNDALLAIRGDNPGAGGGLRRWSEQFVIREVIEPNADNGLWLPVRQNWRPIRQLEEFYRRQVIEMWKYCLLSSETAAESLGAHPEVERDRLAKEGRYLGEVREGFVQTVKKPDEPDQTTGQTPIDQPGRPPK